MPRLRREPLESVEVARQRAQRMARDLEKNFEKAIGETPDDMTFRIANDQARKDHRLLARVVVLDLASGIEKVGKWKPEGLQTT